MGCCRFGLHKVLRCDIRAVLMLAFQQLTFRQQFVMCACLVGLLMQQGDDTSSSLASSSVTADISNDPSQHAQASTSGVVGLTNLGNTCFFNSSLQLLLACAPLQQQLLQPEHDITRGPLGYALQQAAVYADGECASTSPMPCASAHCSTSCVHGV